MEVFSVLVTGANRGRGLEFVRQLVRLPKPPKFIFATYRSAETLGELTNIKDSSKECQVKLIKMDVTKYQDIVAARKVVEQTVRENGLTLLINNAGFAKPEAFPNLTEENLLMHFTINTIAPIRVLQEMLPLLQKAAAHNASPGGMRVSRSSVLNLTSMAGCITRTGVEFLQDLAVPGYKTSKAALNMAMRGIAASVKDQGILVVLMCPGWVKTDMGTEHGEITPEESISTMIKTMSTLNESHHGAYMDRHANPYPF